MTKEIRRESIRLDEQMLTEFIRGKKITLCLLGEIELEILPPKYGITITYEDWKEILNNFIPATSESFDLIQKIQSKF